MQVFCFLVVLLPVFTHGRFTPVALMHGMTASNETLVHAKRIIENLLPGIYVRNLEVGDGFLDSVFMPMEAQVRAICDAIGSDPNLADGLNLVGFSQGGLGMRGYLERCNDPPVRNFISWVAPQGGQFGCPGLGVLPVVNISCDDLFDCCAYDVQGGLSFASYWIDPFRYEKFLQKSEFLADLNNLRSNKSAKYKANLLQLDNFVMGHSNVDIVLNPRETGWFAFYAEDSAKIVVPLEQTPLYQQDWLGLRTLHDTGRLHRFTTQCEHADYTSDCFDKYFVANVVPFLNTTLP